ncbi:MAG: ferredoxin [Desertimonas sp.]
MKIVIDRELCAGHGRCVELLPDVFELDEDGFSRLRDGAADPERGALERVAALCPELAISYTD